MFSKRIILISLFFLGLSIYSQDEEEDATEDMVPLRIVIQSEMGGKLNFMVIQV